MTQRYDKSQIMKKAHHLRRTYGLNMSQALTQAWKLAKQPPSQKAALQAAFQAKYPGGTLRIHQFWRGATVQFVPNGKEYTYKNYGWQQKLGLTA